MKNDYLTSKLDRDFERLKENIVNDEWEQVIDTAVNIALTAELIKKAESSDE